MENENKRLGYIEKKIDDVKKITIDLSQHITELSSHLFGNKRIDISDEGVIGKIQEDIDHLKKGHEVIRDELQKNEVKQVKYNVYILVMWACIGAVAMGIFMYVIQQIKFK